MTDPIVCPACSSEWEHDGNCGRYCPKCGLNHPTTPSLPMDDGKRTQQELFET